ncbi:polysaccharide pyruvyl transferase family protein [Sphingobium sp. BYY-5]|uniref:polysaccharide pyruvyl transferase family protein n=1 Tax=Sphingobium sp. BYY-5 TaxID=2926400 RepID=UPI001FA74202|nr:polysaccharide pyruvyl transferase family protein [Sphingobium sp. BYY-5]MCI4592660.1 polysaccharide pyruvyl transferase family protein [Sphingobium sp. BYY-5]
MMETMEDSLTAQQLVRSLSTQINQRFEECIAPGPVALVDFPDHSNVGDSAIWLGEMAWLTAAGRAPVYTCSLNNFSEDDLRRAAPTGPILIHGGGNFGTTWLRHEQFRLRLLRNFPDRPIIQLPQSIFYDDADRSAEMAQAIRDHGAFTLLVRDAKSFAFAERHFDCEVKLCPDAAIYLGCHQRLSPKADILALLRTDHEAVAGDAVSPPPATIAQDWLEEGRMERTFIRARVKVDSLRASTDREKRLRRYQLLADWRLRRGFSILSQGQVVVTDRLHAHILSLLLDIPHVALDNSYGKLSGFAAHWTREYRGFHQATTRQQAFALAQGLIGKS